jgi:hypothetical protein
MRSRRRHERIDPPIFAWGREDGPLALDLLRKAGAGPG